MNEKDYLAEIEQDFSIFGRIFLEKRLAKGIKAIDAYDGVCDKKTLYNFEKGKTCINLIIISGLLKNIKVNVEEYFAAVYKYQLSENEKLIKQVAKFYYDSDAFSLKQILARKRAASNLNTEDYAYIVMISSLICDIDPKFKISEDELQKASDYFTSIKIWGYSELVLFCNTAHILDVELTCLIAKDLIRKIDILCANDKNKFIITRIFLNLAYSFLTKNLIEDANYFLEIMKSLLDSQKKEDSVPDRHAFRFMRGYYHLISGDTLKGKALMEKAIDLFEVNEIPNLVKQYKKYYEEALLQAKKLGKLETEE